MKEKKAQMAFLDDLQKQADSLGELAKQITDHRNQYKSSGTLCHKSNDHFKTEIGLNVC